MSVRELTENDLVQMELFLVVFIFVIQKKMEFSTLRRVAVRKATRDGKELTSQSNPV